MLQFFNTTKKYNRNEKLQGTCIDAALSLLLLGLDFVAAQLTVSRVLADLIRCHHASLYSAFLAMTRVLEDQAS
jgi:hypothetical protein